MGKKKNLNWMERGFVCRSCLTILGCTYPIDLDDNRESRYVAETAFRGGKVINLGGDVIEYKLDRLLSSCGCSGGDVNSLGSDRGSSVCVFRYDDEGDSCLLSLFMLRCV